MADRAQHPGGWAWVRADDDARTWDPPPPLAFPHPTQHDLYPHEHPQDQERRERFQPWQDSHRPRPAHEHGDDTHWQKDDGGRPELTPPLGHVQEPTDASLEVMDIATYAETLRANTNTHAASSAYSHQQPESPRASFHRHQHQQHRPTHSLPSAGGRSSSSPFGPRPLPSSSCSSRRSLPPRPPPPPQPIASYYPASSPHDGYLLPVLSPTAPFSLLPSSSSPASSSSHEPPPPERPSARYHYFPPPEADRPGYFPPNASVRMEPDVWETRAPHHERLERPGGLGSRGGGEDGEFGRENERETLRTFPKWSRDWFRSDQGRRGEYDGLAAGGRRDLEEGGGGGERWEGGGLTGGDLGESASWSGREGGRLTSSSVGGRSSGQGGGSRQGGSSSVGDQAAREERIKERRLRRLEKEFGDAPDKTGKTAGGGADDTTTEPVVYPVGSLDPRSGTIVTPGPRKRLALRWGQGLVGLATCALALYPMVLIKPPSPSSPSPPPKSTLPAYLFSALSVLSLILTLAFHLIRPLCCSGSSRGIPKDGAAYMGGLNPLGGSMLVGGGLPHQGKKGREGKGAMGQGGGGVMVNLVVDPRLFQQQPPPATKSKRKKKRRRRHRRRRDEDGLLSSSDDSSTSSSSSDSDSPPTQTQPLRSPTQTLLRRHRRRWAHKWLVRLLILDLSLTLFWIAGLASILWKGQRCPVGGFQGWCDCWNGAIAGGYVLVLLCGASAVLGVGDVRRGDPGRVGDDEV